MLVEALDVSAGRNSLAVLADEIRQAHADVCNSHIYSVQRMVDAGKALLLAKEQVPTRQWAAWVSEHTDLPGRTARRYMRLAGFVAENLATVAEIAEAGQNGALGEHNHRAQGTGENEWFTPERYIRAARGVMGSIDLDPASHAEAQKTVQAKQYFTIEDDGLAHPWHGKVWLNPPYGRGHITDFAEKAVEEFRAGRMTEGIVLTHNYTDTLWFQHLAAAASLVCFTRGRIEFVDIDGKPCNPTQGQAFCYLGDNVEDFARVFGRFGMVLRTM